MANKVKLEIQGVEKDFIFEHALNLLRLQKKQGRNDFKVVGNHEFVNNELIIHPSKRSSKKSSKPITGKEGDGLRKPSKDIDPSVQ